MLFIGAYLFTLSANTKYQEFPSLFTVLSVWKVHTGLSHSMIATGHLLSVRVPTRISILPSWPTSIIYPTTSIWTRLSHFSHPERLRQPRKGPPLAAPGAQKPGSASFQAASQTPCPSPSPSLGLFPLPRPIQWAPPAPRSGAPCSRTAAVSGGSPPEAANNTGRA